MHVIDSCLVTYKGYSSILLMILQDTIMHLSIFVYK